MLDEGSYVVKVLKRQGRASRSDENTTRKNGGRRRMEKGEKRKKKNGRIRLLFHLFQLLS